MKNKPLHRNVFFPFKILRIHFITKKFFLQYVKGVLFNFITALNCEGLKGFQISKTVKILI